MNIITKFINFVSNNKIILKENYENMATDEYSILQSFFDKYFYIDHNVNHSRRILSGETTDNYWIKCMEEKDGNYWVMIGKKGKSIGNSYGETEMNMFLNKTISKQSLENEIVNTIEKDRNNIRTKNTILKKDLN